MKKNVFYASWYLITLAGMVFCMTILLTLKKHSLMYWGPVTLLAVAQGAGMVYYLHRNPWKAEPKWRKILFLLLRCSSAAVVAVLCVLIYSLACQYHNPMDITPNDGTEPNIAVQRSDDLYIMRPQFDGIRLVTGTRPSRSDNSVLLCCAATFDARYSLSFDHAELAGCHVQDGMLYKGYDLKNLGAFTWVNGTCTFAGPDEADTALQAAAENGGCAFQQYLLIDDGVIQQSLLQSLNNQFRCFRALAELNGEVCVIDAAKPMKLYDFVSRLQALGVTNAFYMDTGEGWNYSWYRDNNDATQVLIGMPFIFSHNWLVFTKAD